MLEASAVELLGSALRSTWPANPSGALLLKWSYMTGRKPVKPSHERHMCHLSVSHFCQWMSHVCGWSFFSRGDLWNHDSEKIALIKTSKSWIVADCFVFLTILTCPHMNHNITPPESPYTAACSRWCAAATCQQSFSIMVLSTRPHV